MKDKSHLPAEAGQDVALGREALDEIMQTPDLESSPDAPHELLDPALAPPVPGTVLPEPTEPTYKWKRQVIETINGPLSLDEGPVLVVPFTHEVWEDGIFERRPDVTNEPVEAGLDRRVADYPSQLGMLKRLTYSPIIITRSGRRLEDGTGLVCLHHRPKHAWEHIWVELGDVMDRKRLLMLVKHRLMVSSEIAGQVTSFLFDFYGQNKQALHDVPVVRRSGEVEAPDMRGWFIGTQWIGHGRAPICDTDPAPIVKALETRGDYDKWRAFTSDVFERHWIARWLVAAAYVPPMMKAQILNVRTFILNQWEQSGGGKSAIAKIGQSVWGNPDRFKFSMNTTKLGPQTVFRNINTLPILFDDLEHNSIQALDEFVMDVCNEEPRLASTQDGETRRSPIKEWRVLIRVTAEARLVGRGREDLGGQQGRALEVKHPGMPEAEAKAIHDWFPFHESWGHAGPAFLRQLLPFIWDDTTCVSPVGRATLRDKYLSFMTAATARGVGLRLANLQQIAAITLADYLMLRWVYDVPREAAELLATSDMTNVIDIMLGNQDDQDSLAQRFALWLLSHYRSTPQLYADLETPEGCKRATTGAQGANQLIGLSVHDPESFRREMWYHTAAIDNLVARDERWKGQARSKSALWSALARAGVLKRPNHRYVRQIRSRVGVIKDAPVYVIDWQALETMAGVSNAPSADPEIEALRALGLLDPVGAPTI